MPSLITLGLVEILFDLVVDNVKRELLRATTIKRAILDDQQLVIFNEDDMVDAAVRDDINIGVGVGACAGASAGLGATSCSRCSGFLCEMCKKHDEDSIMYLQTLSQAVNKFKNKRGVKVIPSKNVRNPYTPQAKRRKKILYQGNTEFEEENIWKIANGCSREAIGAQYIDEILSLMRERQLRYPEHYDSMDRIMDLNFYTNFKQMYDSISEEATRVGGKSFTQLLNKFVWNDDMIDYVRGIRPYPGGIDWICAKRILAVMNLNNTHFVTLEILLHEGRLNVYDYNLTVRNMMSFFDIHTTRVRLAANLVEAKSNNEEFAR